MQTSILCSGALQSASRGAGALALLSLFAVACAEPDPGRGNKADGVGKTDPDPGEDPIEDGGDDTASGALAPLRILPDAPAFYDDDGTVTVSGVVEGSEGLLSLVANGEVLVVPKADESGNSPFSLEVPLGDDPWMIVNLVGTPTSGAADIQVAVQAAAAEPGAASVSHSLQTGVGAAGLDDLADALVDGLGAADLGPGAGTTLADSLCDSCPPELECEQSYQSVVSTGDWSVGALASLDTSGGDVVVDLGGTTISWGAIYYGTDPAGVSGTLTATLEDGSPVATSEIYSLDVKLGEGHVWAADWGGDNPGCITDTEITDEVDDVYVAKVPPALSAAVVAWSSWVEGALANEIEGASLHGLGAADASGLYVAWTAAMTEATPVVALRSGFSAPDGIEHALDDALLGALFTQDLGGIFPYGKSWSDGSGGPTIAVNLLGVADGTAALTAAGETDDLLLPPIDYQITLDGADEPCEIGHLIPSPGTLDRAVRAQRVPIDVVALDVGVAGSDVAESCGLGAARDAYLAAALASALYGASGPVWGAGLGMADAGAILELSVDNGAFRVAVTP